ncbi:cell division-specific peptidoglycan biosynthesis regulator FtsW [Thermosyntropha lipolytica DSM 11003]|uniref:Probable peptidoglycan glycosyltransferase FtsW n=1 Tax=Thermosyntropha lipolytica DSM 11003 TaxID=1123382 RepID=A0A1M5NYB3_9FIRM|nr:putative lipid II flippase FtsW [Thermosyntropha lipolytica]SHG94457.1 cell division-specific peptidoglycan biosynthesis regulator FtsW [Thermosyntropha lipolytica DSM 11003]
MRLKKGPPDFVLFVTILALLSIGLIMVFSASSVTSNVKYGDAYYYFKRQLIWAGIGLVIMMIIMRVDLKKIKALAYLVAALALVCLILVLTPLGITAKGSSRWLGVGFLSFTPSELAKLGMVMFMARNLEVNLDNIKSFTTGILPYLVVLGLVCGLIMMQPDLGTSFALAGTVFFMLLAAGARWNHLVGIAAAGMLAIMGAIAVAPYRMERFIAFLNPWKYARDEGFQTVQSLYALGSGGLFGMGLGRSRQKFFYLPEQHTDFIFAILGEELGFIGVFLVIALFILLAWRGFKIAINAPDNFSSLLATGITTMIVFQAAINIGVVCGALPVTGITLPFISYGGSSLLFTLIGAGILLNISRYSSIR